MMVDITEVRGMQSFLNSLQNPTMIEAVAAILLGVIGSFLADWVPGFSDLSARAKRLYWLIVPVALGVVAVVGSALLNAQPVTADTVFLGIVAGGTVFLGSQAAHTRKL